MSLGMAQAYQDDAGLAFLEEPQAGSMENNEWFTALLSSHFHVLPAQLGADPGAKSLGNGLFGRESRREERRWNAVRQAIFNLVGVKDPVEKSFPKPLVGGSDAFDFDDIYAHAKDHFE
jgi:hypothetical protein